jgi:SAM-dependent methyltransferase
MDRKHWILQGADPAKQTGLEIGPLHNPIVGKGDGQVFYVDHCSAAELRLKYEGQIAPESIHDVDFVWAGQSLSQAVGGRTFDYVIASHVIEHVPDIITWLDQVAAVLEPNGVLCLAVPDRQFTFDYLRPISTVGEMLDAYFRKAKVPTPKHLYDNYTMACQLDKEKAWRGEIDQAALNRLHPPGLAMQFVRRSLDQGEYLDCHCWVFTPQSFLSAMEELLTESLLPFAIAHFCTTQPGELEFFVTLRK